MADENDENNGRRGRKPNSRLRRTVWRWAFRAATVTTVASPWISLLPPFRHK
jgi:hypothetical protein